MLTTRWAVAIGAPLVMIAVCFCGGCGGSSSGEQIGPVVPPPPTPQTHTDVLTQHNDVSRTGQNPTETVLTHANVNATSFGKLFSVTVDGKVDAQPLYISSIVMSDQTTHSVIYVATEHGSVYAVDAAHGAILWQVTLLATGETPSDDLHCGQVTPEIGVTATPVIDRSAGTHGTIYLLAMSKDANGAYHHRLHALDITTGQEEFDGPREIGAAYPGNGDNSSNGQVVFDSRQYNSRPGLLLLNGVVYSGWGSHCDIRPYTGWLIGYDRLSLQQVSVFNFTPNGNEGALWNSGAGIAADASTGKIFVSVSNGTFDTVLNINGFPASGDYGNAFVRLNTTANELLPEDYWTMSNTASESNQDQDLGSGGVLLLPDVKNANGQTVQLGTGGGKDGHLYVFNRQNMGKFNPQSNSTIYQDLPTGLAGPVFSTPAWFNGTVYYGAVGDRIRAFTLSGATLPTQATSATDNFFGFPGATPSISANGTNDAILWAAENSDPAVLHAYDAGNLTIELYNSKQATGGRDSFGTGNKFITPTIADGRVIVGTTNSIAVFGLMK